jgi:hypothetical protein
VNLSNKDQEELILEIANLEDEIDSCITGDLTTEKLDKQKEYFRKHDNYELGYRGADGTLVVEGPRFNHRDRFYEVQEEKEGLLKTIELAGEKIHKLEKANERLKKRLAKSKK